jgi:hypothetical protein
MFLRLCAGDVCWRCVLAMCAGDVCGYRAELRRRGAEPPADLPSQGGGTPATVAGGRNPQRNPPYLTFTLPALASSNCSVLYIESAIIQQMSPMIA